MRSVDRRPSIGTHKYRNILLVRTDRIGDVVLTTPAISLLHSQFPQANLYFLTRAYTVPLLKHHRYLHHILIYQPESEHRGWRGHLRLARQLKALKIDLVFLFYPKAGLAMSLFLAGIRQRVGTGYRWFSFLLNYKIYEHRKYGRKHELEYNLSLLAGFINHVPPPEDIRFQFTLNSELAETRKRILSEKGIQGDYLIVHPGSGGSSANLPPAMFVRILHYLAEKSDMEIFLVGEQREKSLLDGIKKECTAEVIHPVAGEWNLETYLAIIAGSRFFISNSTGPLHMARALEVPLLAFYCPAIPCAPRRWGPYHQLESVIIPPVEPCRSGDPEKCPHGNCLDKISWEMIQPVLDKRLLNTGHPPRP